jgi:hypothetical protein
MKLYLKLKLLKKTTLLLEELHLEPKHLPKEMIKILNLILKTVLGQEMCFT